MSLGRQEDSDKVISPLSPLAVSVTSTGARRMESSARIARNVHELLTLKVKVECGSHHGRRAEPDGVIVDPENSLGITRTTELSGTLIHRV
jgi:hypothetical protein